MASKINSFIMFYLAKTKIEHNSIISNNQYLWDTASGFRGDNQWPWLLSLLKNIFEQNNIINKLHAAGNPK